jgi:hypothetical protein
MPLTRIKQSGIAANTFVGGEGIVVTANTTTSQLVITSTGGTGGDGFNVFFLAGI